MKHNKKRRRYTKLRIDETSAVDKPAQEPAVAVALFKRAPEFATGGIVKGGIANIIAGETPIHVSRKGYVADEPALTSSTEGHTHLIDISTVSGNTSWGTRADSESGHSHPYVVTDGGAVSIGEADGHTHDVEVIASKNDNGEPMSDTKNQDANARKAEARIAELEKGLANQTALASMTDAEKAHLSTLSGDDASTFIAADTSARATTVEATKAADAVVFKSLDGIEYRKSDDARLIDLAKRADEQTKQLAVEKAARETEVYKARAKVELAHLTGEEATQIALLKAVDGIQDETVRTAALEILKSNSAGVAKAFDRAGSTGGDKSLTDPEAKLEALAKAHAEANSVSFTKAYSVVSDTTEGRKLLAESFNLNTAQA